MSDSEVEKKNGGSKEATAQAKENETVAGLKKRGCPAPEKSEVPKEKPEEVEDEKSMKEDAPKKRGRPAAEKKDKPEEVEDEKSAKEDAPKKRGRPAAEKKDKPKEVEDEKSAKEDAPKKRGRPAAEKKEKPEEIEDEKSAKEDAPKKRGRPAAERKEKPEEIEDEQSEKEDDEPSPPKRGRGRPKKGSTVSAPKKATTSTRGRGRLPKQDKKEAATTDETNGDASD